MKYGIHIGNFVRFKRDALSLSTLLCFLFLSSCTSPDSDAPGDTLSKTSSNKFISLGSNGSVLAGLTLASQVMYSTDGSMWTGAQVPTGPPPGNTWQSWDEGLAALAWGGDRFFAMGSGLRKRPNSPPYVFEPESFPVIYTSPDAISWTRSSFACYCFAVTRMGDTYVLAGASGGIYTSPDAANWTKRSTPTAASLRALAWTGTMLVAVGDNDILTSLDGVTWAKRDSTTSLLNSVTWGSPSSGPAAGVLVTVGESGTILRSFDGIVWMNQHSGVTSHLRSVIWDGNRFVTVGAQGVVLVSPDGQGWTRFNLDGAATPEINTVIPFGTRAVASSNDGTWMTR